MDASGNPVRVKLTKEEFMERREAAHVAAGITPEQKAEYLRKIKVWHTSYIAAKKRSSR